MIVFTDMKLSDGERVSLDMPYPMEAPKPEYPYGLSICLTDKELAKLGLDPEEATIGGVVHLHALACITSVNIQKRDDGSTCRVELQIEKLAVESEDAENEEAEKAAG